MIKVKWSETVQTFQLLTLVVLVLFLIWKAVWLIALAVILLLLSLKENPVSTKISGAWLTLAEAMGAVSTKVILTIIFFVFLVPVAWLYRLFEKELTHHFFQKKSDSYFMDKKQNYSKDIFEKTW